MQITYKYWSEDPEWQPEEDEDDDEDEEDKPLYILKDGYIPLSAFPIVSPNLDSLYLDQVMADLSKLPQDYLTEENKKEWEEFVEKLRSSGVTRHTTRPLPELSCINGREQPPTLPSSSVGAKLPPSIQTLIDKENKRTPMS